MNNFKFFGKVIFVQALYNILLHRTLAKKNVSPFLFNTRTRYHLIRQQNVEYKM